MSQTWKSGTYKISVNFVLVGITATRPIRPQKFSLVGFVYVAIVGPVTVVKSKLLYFSAFLGTKELSTSNANLLGS